MSASVPKTGPSRVPYLTVERDGAPRAEATVSVPVRFGSTTVEVIMDCDRQRNDFSVPLSRIWAWALSTRPTLAGAVTPRWTASITLGSLPADRLY